jgi:hypothetical protein
MVRCCGNKRGGNYLRTVDLQRNFKQPELYFLTTGARSRGCATPTRCIASSIAPARAAPRWWASATWWAIGIIPKDDAWFNSWFQTLRTAYGCTPGLKNVGDKDVMLRAERVLNLALQPRKDGAFPIIYLLKSQRWSVGDGWAAFVDDYHAFSMSWTGYWMLRFERDLVRSRPRSWRTFAAMAIFLLAKQLASGCIPSWYDANLHARRYSAISTPKPRDQPVPGGAGRSYGRCEIYAPSARKPCVPSNEVLPHAWFDYETFHSCARKPFDFYDRWTAQYPQNNLSTMQAAMAYLKLYHLTKDKAYLETGREVVDYLLLTQQVWNHPLLSPRLLGGFTTQNTDAEWSDARQNYAALILLDYYNETGEQEYLERSVAAARSTFSVAPWENWAHTGFIDEKGSLTGIHWGTGSAMTSVELMAAQLGDAYVNLKRKQGTGFNACTLERLTVDGTKISFNLTAAEAWKTPLGRFEAPTAAPVASRSTVSRWSR